MPIDIAAVLAALPAEPFTISFSPGIAALIVVGILIYRQKG